MNPPIYIADHSDYPSRDEQANSLNNGQQTVGQSNQETNSENQCCAGACQINWKPNKAVNG